MFPVTILLVLMTFRNMAFLMAVATAMVVKAQTERKMTVDELFQLVESNSKTLRQEKISVEFAKKGIEAARSARLPELTASASVSMTKGALRVPNRLSGWKPCGIILTILRPSVSCAVISSGSPSVWPLMNRTWRLSRTSVLVRPRSSPFWS